MAYSQTPDEPGAVLILGSYDEQGCDALIGEGVEVLPLTQGSGLYAVEPAHFLSLLANGTLVFHAYGDQSGAWEATFNKDQLQFKSFAANTERNYSLSYDVDSLPGQTIMFTSGGQSCYGVIKSVNYSSDDKKQLPDCVYSVNDKQMLFEVFLNVEGKVLKGCGAFEKRKN